MSIGENLKAIRKNRSLTQDQLAIKIGISRPMLAQIERGTKALALPLSVEISKVLDCSVYDLINGLEADA